MFRIHRPLTIAFMALTVLCLAGPASADVWVLPNGTILITDGPGSTTVSRENNLLYDAAGTICSCGGCQPGPAVPHFHGTLGGKGDKGKPCGHGKVTKIPSKGDTAGLVKMVTNLNTAVCIILSGKWGAECVPNGETAIDALDQALEQFPGILEKIDELVKDKAKRKKLRDKATSLEGKLKGAKLALQLGGETSADQAKGLIDKASSKIQKRVKKFFKDLRKAGVY